MPGDGTRYPLSGAGAPVDNTTGLGTAVQGSQYMDTANGKRYTCTATNKTSTIAWVLVGAQV